MQSVLSFWFLDRWEYLCDISDEGDDNLWWKSIRIFQDMINRVELIVWKFSGQRKRGRSQRQQQVSITFITFVICVITLINNSIVIIIMISRQAKNAARRNTETTTSNRTVAGTQSSSSSSSSLSSWWFSGQWSHTRCRTVLEAAEMQTPALQSRQSPG